MKKFLPFLALFFYTSLFAQTPTVQDCLGAIPVCQQVYSETTSPSGDGNYNNEVLSSNTCTAGELNSIWYTFTVNNSGDFGFLITPNNLNDDYDWALYNITTVSCEEITNNSSAIVSCNAAGGGSCDGETGATGATNQNNQGGGCGGGNSSFNDLIPVVAGNTYALMVSNWSGSTNGYTLDFGLADDIGVLDTSLPSIAEVTDLPEECAENTITVVFNEPIQCSTIESSQFSLTGPSQEHALILTSTLCDQGGEYHDIFQLTAVPPISESGTYTLNFDPDNSTQSFDFCDNPATDFELSFEVMGPFVAPDINLADDTIALCVGNTIVLDATEENAETYTWSNGAATPTISVNDEGAYGVTVTNICGSSEDEINVAYVFGPPTVDFGDDITICEGESVTLNALNPFAQYEWQDGTTESNLVVTEEGMYTVSIENDCGTVNDEIFIEVISAVDLNFPVNTALCPGDFLTLDATSEAATYQWSTGSTDPVLEISDVGSYTVTVTTPCEVVEITTEVFLLDANTANLLPDTLLCQDEVLNVNITIANSTYEWEDGSTLPTRQIAANGEYAVTVVAPCATYEDEFSVNYIPVVQLDLGIDQYLCPDEIILSSYNEFSEFSWSNGSNDSLIIVTQPDEYSVRVFNRCEEVLDTIQIFECEICDIYVPNAFSPNFDGINDDFKPLTDCELLDYTFRIFNRWGNLVYESIDATEAWTGEVDGKFVANGVYIWVVEYTVIENLIPRLVLEKGDITVLK